MKILTTRLIKYARDTESLITKSNSLDNKNVARSFAMSVRHIIPIMDKTVSLLPNTKCSVFDLAFDTSNYSSMINASKSSRVTKNLRLLFKNNSLQELESIMKTSESLVNNAVEVRLRILVYCYSLMLVAYQAGQNTIGYVNEMGLADMTSSMVSFINNANVRIQNGSLIGDFTSNIQFKRLLAFNKNLRNDIK